jgi:hypothetical protein
MATRIPSLHQTGSFLGVALQVQLQQVRKRSSGRVHLTVRIPKDGPVNTLCGQTYKSGEYEKTDDEADCKVCLRRQGNEAVVSSAFFNQDLGEELLRLSLQQARGRRPAAEGETKRKGKKAAPKLVVVPKTEPEPARVLGELELAGLKKVSDTVYLSPAGAIVRLRKHGSSWLVEEVAFNGPAQVTRKGDRILLKVGDLRAEISAEGGRIQAVYREEAEE